MKKDKIKRWYFDLTEKQVRKIIVVFEIVYLVILISRLNTMWFQLAKANDALLGAVILITMVFLAMFVMGVAIWMFLWENPYKQRYLHRKEYDEKIVPMVREKFNLSTKFKEVLYEPARCDEDFKSLLEIINSLGIKYFAKEVENTIFVSIRTETGEELKREEITNYISFEKNYKPIIK